MVGKRSTGTWSLVTAVLLAAALSAPAGAAAVEWIDPRCEASAGSPCELGSAASPAANADGDPKVVVADTFQTRDSTTDVTIDITGLVGDLHVTTVTGTHSANTRAVAGQLEVTPATRADVCEAGNLRDSSRPSSCQTQVEFLTGPDPCIVATAQTEGAELSPVPDLFAVGASSGEAVRTCGP